MDVPQAKPSKKTLESLEKFNIHDNRPPEKKELIERRRGANLEAT